MKTPVVAFVAKSNSGKTTLLEKIIAELKRRGYRVGAIKHDAHRFDIDKEGKDSWRLTQAGADTMVISSKEKMAMVKIHSSKEEMDVFDMVERYFSDVDIVLTEGFKKSPVPKIEVHRKERSRTLICRGDADDSSLIAVASDEFFDVDVPLFDINDYNSICNFIERRFFP